MNSAIERIIKNDRKARDAVAAAERYRREAADLLAENKALAEKEIRENLSRDIKEAKERSERKSNRKTEEYRKNAGAVCTCMEVLYKEKKTEWIELYTNRIINGK